MVSNFYIAEMDYFNKASAVDINESSWIASFIDGPHGRIPKLNTDLSSQDKIDAVKIRIGINRDSYSVLPGLYAIGEPDKTSPVLITANYKLTVDMLRKELNGISAWIVVQDTKGVNVWCAAGKGTFGTYEVIKKIKELKLKDLVNHRTVILPQLAAPGVAAFQVLRHSGFKAVFGPVRAEDLKEFLHNGMKASEAMRTVTFDAISRLVLTPIELVHNLKLLLIMLVGVLLYNLTSLSSSDVFTVLTYTAIGFAPLLTAVVAGCVLVPLLLPYIPFRAFAAKGFVAGLVIDILLILLTINTNMLTNSWLLAAYCVSIPAVTALLSLNFTGSTTYTSFSGVKKETKLTLTVARAAIVLGIVISVISKLV